MNRIWREYLNEQKYNECQLVTALNAYYYLTGKTIKQDSKRYEELVDLAAARYGSAITIDRVFDKLGLVIIKESNNLFNFERKNKVLLPLEYNVWHKKYGFHSTLIVDHEPKSDAVRITNFKHETTLDGWLFREDLYKFAMRVHFRKTYRLFGLKGENK